VQSFKIRDSTLYLSDSLDVMRSMESKSIDSIVTDPPYGLKFMGKSWDHGVPGVPFWEAALRVAKPGAFMLAFGGTRTFHRLAVAIEDAGWEIRDTVMWVYGSGFPKSLDVSKAIDREAGVERKVVGVNEDYLRRKPNGMKTAGATAYGYSQTQQDTDARITAPATDAARQWEGWGTALKPAHEPICMARKPLSEKTVAENVLKWGTGGINVDGCRVGTNDELTHGGPLRTNSGDTRSGKALGMFQGGTPNTYKQSPQGRFPANLIHDGSEEVLACFPDSNGSGPARVLKRSAKPEQDGWGMNKNEPDDAILVDAGTGSAARFFYCAKASKAERDAGCENLEERFVRRDDGQPFGMNTNQYRPDGSERKSIPPRHNNHPTVKPLALMRYLCRLVTPPGGIILDPFMGSGSTGVAAELEGFRFIGIDQDKEAFDIACRRVSYVR